MLIISILYVHVPWKCYTFCYIEDDVECFDIDFFNTIRNN